MVGGIASAINAIAGGGTLVSFPVLTVSLGLTERIANATNSVGLFPGSFASAFGYKNLFEKAGHHLKTLFLPTLLGSLLGSLLLLNTSDAIFRRVIPFLILLAALMLILQPKVKAMMGHTRTLPVWAGIVFQFFVSLYGGYFGAGMGIMMLASFAFYMEGSIHELNAVKNWLAVIINVVASAIFFYKHLVEVGPALVLVAGGIAGGFIAARVSQRFDPDKLRTAIAIYGLLMAAYFAYKAF